MIYVFRSEKCWAFFLKITTGRHIARDEVRLIIELVHVLNLRTHKPSFLEPTILPIASISFGAHSLKCNHVGATEPIRIEVPDVHWTKCR